MMNKSIKKTKSSVIYKTKPKLYRKMCTQEKDIKQILMIQGGKLEDITKQYKRTWLDLKSKPHIYEFRGHDFTGLVSINHVIITR